MNQYFPDTLSWGPVKIKTGFCQGWQGPEPGHGAATRLALDSIRAVLIFTQESG